MPAHVGPWQLERTQNIFLMKSGDAKLGDFGLGSCNWFVSVQEVRSESTLPLYCNRRRSQKAVERDLGGLLGASREGALALPAPEKPPPPPPQPGISKVMDETMVAGTVVGTPAYLASWR